MMDFGTYEVQLDPSDGKFVVTELLSGKRYTFYDIEDVVNFIKQELESVVSEI